MALDVEAPEPPDLTNRGMPREYESLDEISGSEDFHREELEAFLRDDAWREGFEEWAEYTDLDAEHVHAAEDLGLFRAFDFYWDPVDDRLRFDSPRVPDDWRDRPATESFTSSVVSMLNADLQDLGRTVQEVLEDYLESDDEVSSHLWSEEQPS
jgi:hypothetical protein